MTWMASTLVKHWERMLHLSPGSCDALKIMHLYNPKVFPRRGKEPPLTAASTAVALVATLLLLWAFVFVKVVVYYM